MAKAATQHIEAEKLDWAPNAERVRITVSFEANMPEGAKADDATLRRIGEKVRTVLDEQCYSANMDDTADVPLRIVDCSDMMEISQGDIEVGVV